MEANVLNENNLSTNKLKESINVKVNEILNKPIQKMKKEKREKTNRELKLIIAKLKTELKRLKQKNNADEGTSTNQNQYELLMDIADDTDSSSDESNNEDANDDEENVLKLTKVNAEIKNNIEKKNEENINKNKNNSKNNMDRNYKKFKMPPISVFKTDSNILKNTIKNNLKIINFLIKDINEMHIVIYSNCLNDYSRICELLKKTNTNYYTYTPKSEKKITLVMKGLNSRYTCEEILDSLKMNENENIQFEKVTRLTTKYSLNNNITLPHFIVQAKPNSSVNEIMKIRSLDHHIIKWENLHKTQELQCTRCQRFSHSAANCNMDFRCVKCGKNHTPGECEIKKEDPKERLFCILCKTNGHPASFKGCQEHQQRIKKREELQKQLKEKIADKHIPSIKVNSNMTYSNVVRNLNKNNNTNLNEIQNNTNQINTNQNTILEEIRNSIKNLEKKFNDKIDHIYEILNIHHTQ